MHKEKRFHYFLDKAKHIPEYRLNIIGHASSSMSSAVLFQGACLNCPGMNLKVFCETISTLFTDIKNKGLNIRCVRIIACHSGASGLAQTLANHINNAMLDFLDEMT